MSELEDEDEDQLTQEILAINSIYQDCMIKSASTIYDIQIPDCAVSARLSFPTAYPEVAPSLVDVKTPFDPASIKHILEKSLKDAFSPGMVCVFEFIELSREALQEYEDTNTADHRSEVVGTASYNDLIDSPGLVIDSTAGWFTSEPIVDRKSVFIGRAMRVNSVDMAQNKIELLKQDKKIARASHNITCWRIHRDDGVSFQDSDDDGESAAGGRLLHLMTLTDSWNVVVVVSRWYGGTQLGPDRFRHINNCAREALELGGFINKKS